MRIINGKLDHPEARIETTNRCNSRCIMCPREKMTRPLEDMSMALFVRLVDELKDLGVHLISLFGYGEPLLDEQIYDRIQYCTNIGLETFITTNGSLLGVEAATRLTKAGLTHIRFSYHAVKDKDYEKVHRGLKAQTVFRNLWNFVAINRKHTKVHVTCIPFNGESVEDFKRRFGKADYLEVWKPHNWAGGRNFRQSGEPERTLCMRSFTGPVQILVDGSLILCCFDYDGKLKIGNAKYGSIESILTTSHELMNYRERHKLKRLDGLICETCDQRFKYNESPLLYSNEQEGTDINKTSITKFDLTQGGPQNGLRKNSEIRLPDPGGPRCGVSLHPDHDRRNECPDCRSVGQL